VSAWQSEYDTWKKRPLADRDYVYVWADGVHFNVRLVSFRPIVSPGRAKTAFQHAGAVAGERQRDQAESRG
jgi:hypothetical protein